MQEAGATHRRIALSLLANTVAVDSVEVYMNVTYQLV